MLICFDFNLEAKSKLIFVKSKQVFEQEFILEPLERLRPGGEFWFVVISGLNRLIPKIGTRNHLYLKAIKKRSGHTVYRLRKPEEMTAT